MKKSSCVKDSVLRCKAMAKINRKSLVDKKKRIRINEQVTAYVRECMACMERVARA